MPAHHDLPEHELTDDELRRMLDYGGKDRDQESRDSVGMLAGVLLAAALLIVIAVAWAFVL